MTCNDGITVLVELGRLEERYGYERLIKAVDLYLEIVNYASVKEEKK